MKKLFTLALLLSSLGAFTQVEIKETSVNIEGGKNGFEISIPYADTKAVEKEMKDLFKSWKGFMQEPKGHIAIQHHGEEVWYRNIRVRGK